MAHGLSIFSNLFSGSELNSEFRLEFGEGEVLPSRGGGGRPEFFFENVSLLLATGCVCVGGETLTHLISPPPTPTTRSATWTSLKAKKRSARSVNGGASSRPSSRQRRTQPMQQESRSWLQRFRVCSQLLKGREQLQRATTKTLTGFSSS